MMGESGEIRVQPEVRREAAQVRIHRPCRSGPSAHHQRRKQRNRMRVRLGRGLRAITTEPLLPLIIRDRDNLQILSSTVQYRCPDGNLTGNARTRLPRSQLGRQRLPATSSTPTENRSTTGKIARIERHPATG